MVISNFYTGWMEVWYGGGCGYWCLKLPMGTHIQDLMAWYGQFQLQVKYLNFLEFYTFVGCIVLPFNSILMVNVEVLWCSRNLPTLHGVKTNFECWYRRLYSLYILTRYSPNVLVSVAEWSLLIVMMSCLRVSDWSCSKYRSKLWLWTVCRESCRHGRCCTSGTLPPRLLACWYFSWYIATNYKAVGWPLVGLLSRIWWMKLGLGAGMMEV